MGFLNESDNSPNIDSQYETLRSYSFDENLQVIKKTWLENQDTCTDWSEMHNHWIDLYKSISEVYESDYLLNQLLIHRYLELFRNLRWVATSALSGAYDSAMRDLRFILEDICQAFNLDRNHKEQSIRIKYGKTNSQDRLRGRKLVSKLGLNDTLLATIKNIYNELNDYVHPSQKLLMESVRDPKVVFFYNRIWYEAVLSLHNRTLDAVFCLILNQFPKAAPVFLDRPHVESSLIEMSMKHTLSIGRQMKGE